jgi:RNA polymerase sigma factor (sigma-70 family)
MGRVVTLPYDETRHAIADQNCDVHEALVVNFDKARLRRALRLLPPVEWHVIKRRYGFGGLELTLRDLAKEMGLPTTTVWRIEQRALDRLRTHFGVGETQHSEAA